MQPLTRPITFANHSSLRCPCACLWPEMLMHKCHGTRVPVSTRYKNGRSSSIDDWSWAWSIDLLLFSSEDKTYLLQLTYQWLLPYSYILRVRTYTCPLIRATWELTLACAVSGVVLSCALNPLVGAASHIGYCKFSRVEIRTVAGKECLHSRNAFYYICVTFCVHHCVVVLCCHIRRTTPHSFGNRFLLDKILHSNCTDLDSGRSWWWRWLNWEDNDRFLFRHYQSPHHIVRGTDDRFIMDPSDAYVIDAQR